MGPPPDPTCCREVIAVARSVIVLETGLCLGSADFRHRDLSVLSPDLTLDIGI